MTTDRSGWLLVVAVGTCIAVVVVTMVATLLYVREANDHRRDTQVQACNRGNDIRLELNAVVAHLKLGLPPLPLLDCLSVVR